MVYLLSFYPKGSISDFRYTLCLEASGSRSQNCTSKNCDSYESRRTIEEEYEKQLQHRLRKRSVNESYEFYETMQNRICRARIKNSEDNSPSNNNNNNNSNNSPDFTPIEVKAAVNELKLRSSVDNTGLICETLGLLVTVSCYP